MQELVKYKSYLVLIAALVLAKFVWVPMWDTKQDNWRQQKTIQANLSKTQGLLALRKEMQTRQDVMSSRLANTESQFAQTSNITSYKLTAQSALEKLFKSHDMKLTNSSWRDGLIDDDIQTLLLDIRFTGALKSYLHLLQDLQQKHDFSNISLNANQLSIRGQSESELGNVTGRVSLKLAVKMATGDES